MTELQKIAVLVSQQEYVVAGLKYALKRTKPSMDDLLVLRDECQKLDDLFRQEECARCVKEDSY